MKNQIAYYQSNNFKVNAYQKDEAVLLAQYVFGNNVNTKSFPNTLSILKRFSPGIFTHECKNNHNLPFCEEVKATEIGHLFEHLILEFLKISVEKKYGHADFNGVTSWNWKIRADGLFRININANKKYSKEFIQAFNDAIFVLENLFNNSSRGNLRVTPRA